jgi:glyoxylase-like metal-dependent hydrolase (beta-lactamase superfamily II)
MIKIGRHVYRVLEPGMVYPFDAISILVDQGDHLFLIDSGSGLPGVYEQIATSIIYLGLASKPVKKVYNTHCHINNAGGDYLFHKLNSSTISAHKEDAEAIMKGDQSLTDSQRYKTVFHPVPVGHILNGSEGVLEKGKVTLKYIHTPGHTPGSTSYIIEDPARIIAVIGDALGSLSSKWRSSEEDWWKSLNKISAIEAEIYCTSVKCYNRNEFRELIEKVRKEGALWI